MIFLNLKKFKGFELNVRIIIIFILFLTHMTLFYLKYRAIAPLTGV